MLYSETSIIRHSMGLKLDVRLQRLSDYPVLLNTVNMVTEPHKMVGLERMLDYRGSTVLMYERAYFLGSFLCI